MLIWAHGVNRTMEKGLAPDDHLEVIKNVLGFSFEGISGTVSIDRHGDRMSNYDVIISQNGKVKGSCNRNASTTRMLSCTYSHDMKCSLKQGDKIGL